MTSRALDRFSSPIPYLAILIALLGVCLIATPQALAQATGNPINLGEVIQKSTKGAPPPRVYLKLPQTIPVPLPNPVKANPEQFLNNEASSQPTASTETPQAANEPQPASPADPAAPQAQSAPAQRAAAPEPQIEPGGIASLRLAAFLSDEGQILQRGVNWRIYVDKKDENGRLPLLHNVDGGPIEVELDTGSYIVYAGYGFANLTKHVILDKAGVYTDNFNLQAGAVRLNAVATGDVPLDSDILRFNIYTREGSDNEQYLVVENVKPEHVVKLTEGTYIIVSNYGNTNARVRGEVQIQAGKLINVTMIHNAAKVTLRLVSEPGGEALANTVWTVLTPGGDVVKRAIGAFPTLALAAGDYTAIAKQNDEIYNRDFSVDSGLDRDIEVLATVR